MLSRSLVSKRMIVSGAMKSGISKPQRTYVVLMKNTMSTALKSAAMSNMRMMHMNNR